MIHVESSGVMSVHPLIKGVASILFQGQRSDLRSDFDDLILSFGRQREKVAIDNCARISQNIGRYYFPKIGLKAHGGITHCQYIDPFTAKICIPKDAEESDFNLIQFSSQHITLRLADPDFLCQVLHRALFMYKMTDCKIKATPPRSHDLIEMTVRKLHALSALEMIATPKMNPSLPIWDMIMEDVL